MDVKADIVDQTQIMSSELRRDSINQESQLVNHLIFERLGSEELIEVKSDLKFSDILKQMLVKMKSFFRIS